MSFFEISSSSVSTLLAYVGTLFDNFLPLFLIIVGLAVGLWVLSSLFGVAGQSGDWNYEKDPFLTEADKRYYRKTIGGNFDDEDFDDEDF
jgi:divalent metal cation (Fe/Co/Zn/Cd) transporter